MAKSRTVAQDDGLLRAQDGGPLARAEALPPLLAAMPQSEAGASLRSRNSAVRIRLKIYSLHG